MTVVVGFLSIFEGYTFIKLINDHNYKKSYFKKKVNVQKVVKLRRGINCILTRNQNF